MLPQAHGWRPAPHLLKNCSHHYQGLMGFYFVLDFTKNKALTRACGKTITQHFHTCRVLLSESPEVVETSLPPFYNMTVKRFPFSIVPLFRVCSWTQIPVINLVATALQVGTISPPSPASQLRRTEQRFPHSSYLPSIVLLFLDSSHSET